MKIDQIMLQPAQAQSFNIVLNNIYYDFKFIYSEVEGWLFSVTGSEITVANAPLIPYVNLLAQYGVTNLQLILISVDDSVTELTYSNLQTVFKLIAIYEEAQDA